jgi:hypothetical protein
MSSRRVVVPKEDNFSFHPNLKALSITRDVALPVVPEDDHAVITMRDNAPPVKSAVQDIAAPDKMMKLTDSSKASTKDTEPSGAGSSRRRKPNLNTEAKEHAITATVAWVRSKSVDKKAMYDEIVKGCESASFIVRSQAPYYNTAVQIKQAKQRQTGEPVVDYPMVNNHHAVEFIMFGMPWQYWKGMAFGPPHCHGMTGTKKDDGSGAGGSDQDDFYVSRRHQLDISLHFVNTEVQTLPPLAPDRTQYPTQQDYDSAMDEHKKILRRDTYVYGLPGADALNQGVVGLSYTALNMQNQVLHNPEEGQNNPQDSDKNKDLPTKGNEQFKYSQFYRRAYLEDDIISKVWEPSTRNEALYRFRRATRYRFEILRLWMKLFTAQQDSTRSISLQAAGLDPADPLKVLSSEESKNLAKAQKPTAGADGGSSSVENMVKEADAKTKYALDKMYESSVARLPLAIFELRHVMYKYKADEKAAFAECNHENKTLYFKGCVTQGFSPDKGATDFERLPQWRKPSPDYWPVVAPDVTSEYAWYQNKVVPQTLSAYMTDEENSKRLVDDFGVPNREVFVLLKQLFSSPEEEEMTDVPEYDSAPGSNPDEEQLQLVDEDDKATKLLYSTAKGLEADVRIHEDALDTDTSQFQYEEPLKRDSYGVPSSKPTKGNFSTQLLSPFNMYAPMVDTIIRGIVKAMPLWACAYLSEDLVDDPDLEKEFETDRIYYDDLVLSANTAVADKVDGNLTTYFLNNRANEVNKDKINANKDLIYDLEKSKLENILHDEKEDSTLQQAQYLTQNLEMKDTNQARAAYNYIKECDYNYYNSMKYMVNELYTTPRVLWNAYPTTDQLTINRMDSMFMSIKKQGIRGNMVDQTPQSEVYSKLIEKKSIKSKKYPGSLAMNDYYKEENSRDFNAYDNAHTWAHEQMMRCASEITFPVEGTQSRNTNDYLLYRDVMGYEIRVGDTDASGIYEQWYNQVLMGEGMYRVGQIVLMQNMIKAAAYFNISHYAQLQGHIGRIVEIVPFPHTEKDFVSQNIYIVQSYYEYNGHVNIVTDEPVPDISEQKRRVDRANEKESKDRSKKLTKAFDVFLVSDPFIPFRSQKEGSDDTPRSFFRAALLGDFLWPFDASIDSTPPSRPPWSYSSIVVPNDEKERNKNRVCIGYNLYDSDENIVKWYGGPELLKISEIEYPREALLELKDKVQWTTKFRMPSGRHLDLLQMRKKWHSSNTSDNIEDRKSMVFPEKYRVFTVVSGTSTQEKYVMRDALPPMPDPNPSMGNAFKQRVDWLVQTLAKKFATTFESYNRLGMGIFDAKRPVSESGDFRLYTRDIANDEEKFQERVKGSEQFAEKAQQVAQELLG